MTELDAQATKFVDRREAQRAKVAARAESAAARSLVG